MDYGALIIGIIVGGIIGFLARRPKAIDKTDTIKLQTLLGQQTGEIERLRTENRNLVANAAGANERIKTLENVRGEMIKDFKNVSAELIKEQKLSMVDTQKDVLLPVADEMKKLKEGFDKQIGEMLKDSTANKVSIDEQIKNMLEKSESLQKEANGLANALKNKKTQGCWGETYLENVLQMMGFIENVDYTKEEFFRSDDGNIRTDFILNLPNQKRIIIDSKVSMESYLNYENAETDLEKDRYAKEFIKATEAHIEKLGSKDYQKKVKDSGLDYVFMFMPLESAYILAMKQKPELYSSAQNKNVALITSSLLFPILKTIDMLLKIDKQNKNISEVIEMVNKLYEKYVGFTENFKDVGKKLTGATESYNDALKQLSSGNGNISGWFDKIKNKSGITTNKKIALEYKDE
jgi:DNA recombination protein RmuC